MAPPKPPKKSSTYPDPLIIPPLASHKQTFIILHGRGSNAPTFGPPFLSTTISANPQHTFQQAFPHAKFIFPTASLRRAKIYNRSIIHQWFDNWSLQTPDERSEIQIEGLRETSAFILGLLRREIEIVGRENVVLGGLSQGCAAMLIALLTWDGEEAPVSAAFGMCGWLPFRKQIEEAMGTDEESQDEEEHEDLFGKGEGGVSETPYSQAIGFLREELEMPCTLRTSFPRIPLFLFHGREDEKVPIRLGNDAARCLKSMEADVTFCEYEGLAHWYSSDMLGGLVEFLGEHVSQRDEGTVVSAEEYNQDHE